MKGEGKVILISGATGNIGTSLVDLLLREDVKLRVLVRDEAKVVGLSSCVQRAVGDLDRPETLPDALRGVEQLFFVTPETHQVVNLLEAAQHAGVRHVVKISTIEADRSIGPGKWHRQQEEMIRASGLEWTFLRPTMMMVNTIEWWGSTVKTHKRVYFPGGKGKVSPVDEHDVAAVAAAVLKDPVNRGQIYELTGPQSLSIAEMVHILGKALGIPIRYLNIPAFLAAVWMRRFGLPAYVVQGLLETLAALRRNEYAYVTDTVERVGRVRPRTFDAWCQEHQTAFIKGSTLAV